MRLKPTSKISLIVVGLFLLFLSGCAHTPRGEGMVQEGIASWYGADFHGKPTTSGETYNMYGVSAAHRTLPLGTRIRVTNLENGRSTKLVINDRGPFVDGRILDLSYGAAKRLGTVDTGLARVRIEVLQLPGNYTQGYYTLQFGSYAKKDNALMMSRRLKDRGYTPCIDEARTDRKRIYRVRCGHYATCEEAKHDAGKLARVGLPCIVVGL